MVDKKVKQRVRKAFELLAKSQGIKLSEKDYPEITSEKDETASYNPEKSRRGTINIPPTEANSGTAYFEESSHALRYLVQRKKLFYKVFPSAKQDIQVQEFFGRVGETLGRTLAKGTELEYLFKNEPQRDLKDKETRKSWADRLKKYKGVRNTLSWVEEKQAHGREYLSKAISENYDSLTDLFIDWDFGRINIEEFEDRFRRINRLRKSAILNLKNLKDVFVSKYDLEDAKMYIRDVERIKHYIDEAKRIKNEKDKRYIIQRAIDFFRESCNPKLYFKTDDISLGAKLKTHVSIYSHFAHRKPYEIAQQYSADDLLSIKNLYALPDSKIRRRFFKRKSGLEKAVETAFFIFLPVILVYVFLNIKFTGFAVFGKYNLIAKSFLSIIFVFLLIAFLYFKIRKLKEK